MRSKLSKLTILFTLLATCGGTGAAQNGGPKPEEKQVIARQKSARKLLRMQESNTEKAVKKGNISRSQRAQLKHQMKREKRQLQDNQKEELRDLKDRQKIAKERSRQF